MAGMCAAIAAARNGARTVIVQDRPVFGGNASSEVRMWICGAHGPHNKETGLLEEIQLENRYRNPGGNYSIWDGVLYGAVRFQPGLTALMNCSCTDVEMDGGRIAAIDAWQLTTQTCHRIEAHQFIDCSGDSTLAVLAGAEFRTGREARSEFDEDIEPERADGKTMGNSLLIQLRRTDESRPFTAPAWAYKFDRPEDLAHRINGVNGQNFWWIEIGGLQDTIRDAESIRDELMKIAYGVWDYIKNRAPERGKAENWELDWMGALPGKRENRRCMGDHILTQNDVRSGGEFDDIVAYGGGTMDDHHPAGLLYPDEPTLFHPAPSPYGIPYRTLYSRNIRNLLFAGRNISVTHAALSSTRVMGTCSLLGQAAGTAAALCARNGCDPRAFSDGARLHELQHTLMDDDCWLPGRLRPVSDLLNTATLRTEGEGGHRLRDGMDRDRPETEHAWRGPPGSTIEYEWMETVRVAGMRLVLDSNLRDLKRMPCAYPHGPRSGTALPGSLVKAFRVEARDRSGAWRIVARERMNIQRLVRVPTPCETTAIRLIPEETWGDPEARVFGADPLGRLEDKIPKPPEGPSFREVRVRTNPADLAPPEGAVAQGARKHGISA